MCPRKGGGKDAKTAHPPTSRRIIVIPEKVTPGFALDARLVICTATAAAVHALFKLDGKRARRGTIHTLSARGREHARERIRVPAAARARARISERGFHVGRLVVAAARIVCRSRRTPRAIVFRCCAAAGLVAIREPSDRVFTLHRVHELFEASSALRWAS